VDAGIRATDAAGIADLSSLASMVHDARLVSKLEGEKMGRVREPGPALEPPVYTDKPR
jgi:hypothetical protein